MVPDSRVGQEQGLTRPRTAGGDSELSNRFESLSRWRCVAALGAGPLSPLASPSGDVGAWA